MKDFIDKLKKAAVITKYLVVGRIFIEAVEYFFEQIDQRLIDNKEQS